MPVITPTKQRIVARKDVLSQVRRPLPTARRRGSLDGVPVKAIERVNKLIRDNKVLMVDFRFVDLPGTWQHFSVPVQELIDYATLKSSIWVDGIGFDGSSIRGFQQIQESDMILMPDPETAFVDPICSVPTLSVTCDVFDPVTHAPYTRDPRFVAQKAEAYLKSTGLADVSYWGPEAEFFVFDHVRFGQSVNGGFYAVDSDEGAWNSGAEGENLGYKPRHKEGYFPVAPHDTLQDIRSEMVLEMMKCGVQVEVHHHEVATGGQCEIDMRFTSLTKMADNLMIYKYILRNVARRHGKVVTFMPKPIYKDNGSGMHVHQSLWKGGKPLFYDEKGYAMLSDMAKWYIGGILKHAHALLAFCAPTTNSYKRLTPGYEAPVNLVYSKRNRSAAVRIPMYTENPKAKRLEFRSPDATANPYLAFAAMLMAGLDGVQNKIDPGQPLEKNVYELGNGATLPTVPGSLAEALTALQKDHAFLLKGDVFTKDVITARLEKGWADWNAIRLQPTPGEFEMYFDA